MDKPAIPQESSERVRKDDGSHPKERKMNQYTKKWFDPDIVLRVFAGLGAVIVVGVGLYIWVMKVDDRSKDNSDLANANKASIDATNAAIDGLQSLIHNSVESVRNDIREGHELTRRESREQAMTIGQKLMALELKQAVIINDLSQLQEAVESNSNTIDTHISIGAHASADERLKAFSRRFDTDDRARENLNTRILDLERSANINKGRSILDLPSNGGY